jgi:hypothetical protein
VSIERNLPGDNSSLERFWQEFPCQDSPQLIFDFALIVPHKLLLVSSLAINPIDRLIKRFHALRENCWNRLKELDTCFMPLQP